MEVQARTAYNVRQGKDIEVVAVEANRVVRRLVLDSRREPVQLSPEAAGVPSLPEAEPFLFQR